IRDFEATTYNIENGTVVPVKLDESALLKEKVNRDFTVVKFTFPNLKEGSIIEYKYTIKSPYYGRLKAWSFQNLHPCLYSEYKVLIPPMFDFIVLKKGYLPYNVDSSNAIYKTYSIVESSNSANRPSDIFTISGNATYHMWVMKDVPAFKIEDYLSTYNNHVNRISFVLKSIRYSENNVRSFIKNWMDISKQMLESDNFGKPIFEDNRWMNEIVAPFENLPVEEKARKTFAWVRDNFNCNDYDTYDLTQTLKKTYQSKTGSVADINLLLAGLLYHQGFEVHPVILSTRENGIASETTPILSQFNYAIIQLVINDSTKYLLDASVPRTGFGILPAYCYNQNGRMIHDLPYLVDLSANSLKDPKSEMFIAINNDDGTYTGSYKQELGHLASAELRSKIIKSGKESIKKEIKAAYTSNIEVSNIVIDSLQLYDEPVSVSYDVKMNFDEDIIYFNPMMGAAWKNNPFSADQRIYPVEMLHKINETFVLNMDIPKGYMVEEMPKSTRVFFNENEGMFEYILRKSGTSLQLRCVLKLEKAIFPPDDYQSLRDFFGFVVKKQAEQIVFKKLK
ncbi:MAG: DUF3857 domain-containing protein, partial [Chitinophagaceae bacterium]